MRRFLLRRILRATVALWGIVTIVFVTMRLSGDPVPLMLPPDAPRAELERVRADLGLDQPIYRQYAVYLGNVLHGDLGRSIHLRQPAITVAAERLPATIELALAAFVLAIGVAIPAGLISAARRDSLLDNVVM